jgi:hypothetical protein
MEEANKETRKKNQTPIIDGDARPDINLDPEEEDKKKRERPTEKKFESERHGDVNSLEDYKDAKE